MRASTIEIDDPESTNLGDAELEDVSNETATQPQPDMAGRWLLSATVLTVALLVWFLFQLNGTDPVQRSLDTAPAASADVIAPTPETDVRDIPVSFETPTAQPAATEAPVPTSVPTQRPLLESTPTPAVEPAQPPAGSTVSELLGLDGVTFASGVVSIEPDAAETLDAIAEYLAGTTAIVHIAGYSDTDGNPDWNLQLSAERAALVHDYLLNAGVAADRISFEGYGSTNQLVDEITDADRRTNRRVEVQFAAPSE